MSRAWPQVFRLIQAAGEGLAKSAPAAADGVCDVPEGPPPLVKCAKVHPLPAELRPVILRRGSGRPEAATVFQYKADHPASKASKPEVAEDEVRLARSLARCKLRRRTKPLAARASTAAETACEWHRGARRRSSGCKTRARRCKCTC